MKSLLKKITTKEEAKSVIKNATVVLFFFAGLELLLEIVTANYEFLLITIIEIILITLLQRYQSRISGLLLTVLFLFPLIYQAKNLFTPERDLASIIENLILIFLSIRATEAALKYHGRINVSPHKILFFYKLYLWFGFIICGTLFYDLFFLNDAKIFEYINVPLTIFGFIGLFGYVYNKAILNIATWKWYFYIIIFWDIVYLFLYEPPTIQYISIGLKIGLFIFLFALSLPYYIGLYLYGYKSNCIWNNELT